MKNYILVLLIVGLLFSCGESDNQEETIVSKEKETTLEDSLGWINSQIIENPNDTGLYILKAKYFLTNNDLDRALLEMDRAIAIDSTNLSFLNLKADALYESKDLLSARNLYLKVLDMDDKNIHANIKMAWVSLIAGQHEQCFIYCNNVLKEDQFIPEPYYIKGLAYKELGNFKLAVSNFRTATEQENDYLEAWLQLGYMYDAAEDTLAGAFYENAIRIDSNNIDALYAFGVHLQNWGLAESAIQQYQHILRVNESYHDAYFNIGYLYLEQLHENDSAIKYYDKVIALNPFNYKGYYNRGLAFERNEMMPQAIVDYEKTLELKPDYTLAAKAMSRVK